MQDYYRHIFAIKILVVNCACPGMATCLMQFRAKVKVAKHSEGKNITVATSIVSQLSVTKVTCITY